MIVARIRTGPSAAVTAFQLKTAGQVGTKRGLLNLDPTGPPLGNFSGPLLDSPSGSPSGLHILITISEQKAKEEEINKFTQRCVLNNIMALWLHYES